MRPIYTEVLPGGEIRATDVLTGLRILDRGTRTIPVIDGSERVAEILLPERNFLTSPKDEDHAAEILSRYLGELV